MVRWWVGILLGTDPFCLVARAQANDWMANYEQITDMIVPRSSSLIAQDTEFALFNVTLFKKVQRMQHLHCFECSS